MSTFKFGGECPSTPLRFLPQVTNLPSVVIPADRDFLASISLNLQLFTPCGRDRLVSDPMPSSPFFPEPHDQTSPWIYSMLGLTTGTIRVAPKRSPLSNSLLAFIVLIKDIFNYGLLLSQRLCQTNLNAACFHSFIIC